MDKSPIRVEGAVQELLDYTPDLFQGRMLAFAKIVRREEGTKEEMDLVKTFLVILLVHSRLYMRAKNSSDFLNVPMSPICKDMLENISYFLRCDVEKYCASLAEKAKDEIVAKVNAYAFQMLAFDLCKRFQISTELVRSN